MSDPANYIFLNDDLILQKKAMIPAETSGLYYGAGCFETFLSESGRIFRFKEHIERLNHGLGYLTGSEENNIPDKLLRSRIKKLLEAKNLLKKNARIRVQVSLLEKPRYAKSDDLRIATLISAQPAKKKINPRKLTLSETRVVPSSCRPSQFKLCNMLHYRQAYREAERKGSHDAVMLNVYSFVAETSVANIFWKKGNNIFTPSGECDILPGVMRNSLIEILKDEMNCKVNEGTYKLNELLDADLVWVTNSVIEMAPVSHIDEISFTWSDPFFSSLKEHLETFKKEKMIYV